MPRHLTYRSAKKQTNALPVVLQRVLLVQSSTAYIASLQLLNKVLDCHLLLLGFLFFFFSLFFRCLTCVPTLRSSPSCSQQMGRCPISIWSTFFMRFVFVALLLLCRSRLYRSRSILAASTRVRNRTLLIIQAIKLCEFGKRRFPAL